MSFTGGNFFPGGGGSGGGGGGGNEVVHVLTVNGPENIPGLGIIPEATVADMTALHAYAPAGNGWVEVLSGDANPGPELYHFRFGISWVGPFAPWMKNPPYVFGTNNENVLVVRYDSSLLSAFIVGGQKFSDLAIEGYENQSTIKAIQRTNRVLPIVVPGHRSGRIMNASSHLSNWVCALGIHHIRAESGWHYRQIDPVNGEWVDADPWITAPIKIPGRGGALDFRSIDGEVYPVLPHASGFAGGPARYMPNAQNYEKYLGTWANSDTGVLEWDHDDDRLFRPRGITTVQNVQDDIEITIDITVSSIFHIGMTGNGRVYLQTHATEVYESLLYITSDGPHAITQWRSSSGEIIFTAGSPPVIPPGGSKVLRLAGNGDEIYVIEES